MSDDGRWDDDEEATAVFDIGDWNLPQNPANQVRSTEEIEEATVGLDLADLPPVKAGQETSGEEESTLVLDSDALARRIRQKTGPTNPSATGGEPLKADWLVDDCQLRPFPFERLERVSLQQKRELDELAAILPRHSSMMALAQALESRLQKVIGADHQVRWGGVGTITGAGGHLELDDGIWTWGRVPPGHSRFIVGVQRGLADGWVASIGPEACAAGDHFEFGMVTFVLAEFCAELCAQTGWPAWTWAVNPLRRKELGALLFSGGENLLELVFQVSFQQGVGAVRIVLPAVTVRHLQANGASTSERWSAEAASAWWGGLVAQWPLVVGTVGLDRQELEGLAAGDLVILQRHGVVTDEVRESSVEDGARWLIKANRALCGTLRGGAGGSWQFEIRQEQIMSDREQATVAEKDGQQTQQGQDEDPGINVAAVRLELEVRLGSVEMALADVARLRSGQIIDCGRPLGSPVELVVRGAPVGSGELVCLDGKLGVRILTIQGY